MGAAAKKMRPNERRVRIFQYVDPEDFAHFEELRTSGPVPAAAAELGRVIFKLGLRAWERGERVK